MSNSRNPDLHVGHRLSWLRAAVLGANDGIISTASLLVGVAGASVGRGEILIAGLAGLAGGALSMAAGEYVSVSSQKDAEQADIAREKIELQSGPHLEHEELTQIYMKRGLDRRTASEVARQMMAHDALGTHARDELGITIEGSAKPLHAAAASGITFAAGAMLPLASAWLAPEGHIIASVVAAVLPSLVLLGFLGATAGKAPPLPAIARVALFGCLAMAATWLLGLAAGTLL